MALSSCNADKQQILTYLTCFEVSNTVEEVKKCVSEK